MPSHVLIPTATHTTQSAKFLAIQKEQMVLKISLERLQCPSEVIQANILDQIRVMGAPDGHLYSPTMHCFGHPGWAAAALL